MIDSSFPYMVSDVEQVLCRSLRNDEEKGDNANETSTAKEEHGVGDAEFGARQHKWGAVGGNEAGQGVCESSHVGGLGSKENGGALGQEDETQRTGRRGISSNPGTADGQLDDPA